MSDVVMPQSTVLEDEQKISYWTLVWQQFSKNKLAIFGLWCILVLLAIAIYAPVLASSKPFYVRIGAQVHYPFFSSLFDRNLYENGVDLFFNLQMFLFPILLIMIFGRVLLFGHDFFEFGGRLMLAYGIVSVGFFFYHQFYPHQETYKDWVSTVVEARKQGEFVESYWPLRDLSYRDTNLEGGHPQAPGQRHMLGTDKEGRDIFARMVYGTRISLTIGIIAVSIYIFIGIVLGALAGFFGGAWDLVISRAIEIMLCFPTFFLILTLSALIENKSIFHVMLIIGFTRWPEVARLVRAEFLKLKNMDYVQAAIALGFSRGRVIFYHVLPNALGPVIVTAIFGIASSILIESSLSFLGLGDLSAPSWGEILSQGRQEFKLWLILAPGMAIFFLVSVFNLVGEGLQDAMDPKLRR
ncbi:MAG: ABC transporter permease [Candidatus Cloacimonetes bacterium]|nr:ABC transporter permease [Candidatus Cloacimonadota bacterium]